MLPVIAPHAAPRRRRSAAARRPCVLWRPSADPIPAWQPSRRCTAAAAHAACPPAAGTGWRKQRILREPGRGAGGVLEKMASARAYMRGLAQEGIAAALQQAAALSAENLPAQSPRLRGTRCGSGAGPQSPVPAPPRPAHLQRPAARAALVPAPAQAYKPAAWRRAAAYWSAFTTRRDTNSAPKLRDCLDADVGFIAPPLRAAPGLCAARLPHPLVGVAVPYSPAAARSAAALSVLSQVNSGSSRPKWPYAAVFA